MGHRLDTSCNLSQVFPPTDPIVQRLLLQEDVSYIHDSGKCVLIAEVKVELLHPIK